MSALFDEFVNDSDQDHWEAQKRALEAANTARDFERADKFRKLSGLLEILGHDCVPVRRTQAYFEALDLVYELEKWM